MAQAAARIAGTVHSEARSFSLREVKKYQESKAYRDQGIVWCVASRGWYPCEVVDSWDSIQWPMNQFRSCRLTVKGQEVAAAYNLLFRMCTDKEMAVKELGEQYAPHVLKTRFVLTTEEDNVIPPEAVKQLLAAIFKCPDCPREVGEHCVDRKVKCKNCREWRCEKGHKGYDAVGGLYSVKSDPPVPMAFGNPKNPDDFKPRSVQKAVNEGRVIEVNGIAMGCTLFRKDLFSKLSKPWFDTGDNYTQDIYFCKKAKKELGARFAVHCGCLVGHIDTNSWQVI